MIDVRKLHFTYPGNQEETIRDWIFSSKKGKSSDFSVPAAPGKTTTQNILIHILKRYKGNVRVLGKEVKSQSSDFYEKIGVAFEFPNFYTKFTALENLHFFRSLYSGSTEDPNVLLGMVGLEKDGKTRFSDFSKGMKMRLNFCRAFLNKPEIVFLDEPTSGLDPVNAKKIKDIILEKKAQGKTVFLTTHNMSVAEDVCDRVAFIVDGRIPLIDSPRDLKIQKGKRILRVEYTENSRTQIKNFDLKDIGRNNSFLKLLKGKTIETMHTQEATLEDIFIEVTGRSLV